MNSETLKRAGYENLRRLPNGDVIGTQRMIFTTGLFVGLWAYGYHTRFCYEREADAVTACQTWDGTGDPPGPWIKEKPADRLNPQWSNENATRSSVEDSKAS